MPGKRTVLDLNTKQCRGLEWFLKRALPKAGNDWYQVKFEAKRDNRGGYYIDTVTIERLPVKTLWDKIKKLFTKS